MSSCSVSQVSPFSRNESASTKLGVDEEARDSEAPSVMVPERKNGSLESSSVALAQNRKESGNSEGALLSEEGRVSSENMAQQRRFNFNPIEKVRFRGNEAVKMVILVGKGEINEKRCLIIMSETPNFLLGS